MQSHGRYFEDFKVGEVLATGRRTVEGGDVSRFAGLTGDFNPLHTDEVFARLRFILPVKFGDTIRTEMTVKQARESSKADRGVVTFDVVVKNQRDEVVCTYEESVMMRRRG